MNRKIQNITVIHEHMSISLDDGDLGFVPYEVLCAELTPLYAMGVRRIVDMTNQVMGRNVNLCERLEKNTGIEIVQSTGYYLEALMPPYIYSAGIDEIAQYMIDDLNCGMDGTSRRAGVIGEIASGINQMMTGQKKVFLAAAKAAKKMTQISESRFLTFLRKRTEK